MVDLRTGKLLPGWNDRVARLIEAAAADAAWIASSFISDQARPLPGQGPGWPWLQRVRPCGAPRSPARAHALSTDDTDCKERSPCPPVQAVMLHLTGGSPRTRAPQRPSAALPARARPPCRSSVKRSSRRKLPKRSAVAGSSAISAAQSDVVTRAHTRPKHSRGVQIQLRPTQSASSVGSTTNCWTIAVKNTIALHPLSPSALQAVRRDGSHHAVKRRLHGVICNHETIHHRRLAHDEVSWMRAPESHRIVSID